MLFSFRENQSQKFARSLSACGSALVSRQSPRAPGRKKRQFLHTRRSFPHFWQRIERPMGPSSVICDPQYQHIIYCIYNKAGCKVKNMLGLNRMFTNKPCAAGCGRPAITGVNLCFVHQANPEQENLRIRDYIQGKKIIKDLVVFGMRFEKYDFSGLHFYGCNFKNVSFINCNFSGVKVRMCFFDFANFSNCNFSKTDIQFVSFAGASFNTCNFSGSELVHVNYEGASILDSIFDNSNLYNSRFISAELDKTSFVNCNLKRTYFASAKQSEINFKSSNTAEAVFD